MFWGLTENESWSNQQDRQHKQAASHSIPKSAEMLQQRIETSNWQN
jgi:hypothetical protein